MKRADVLDGDVQRQVWRGGSREGSGRDASVLLMLQRDCMVSTPAIQASQPSSPRALVHSQQVALTRAQDAAAELELSCDPSTTQLEAAEEQARWLLSCSEAGDAGEEAEVDDPIIDRGAQHATGAPGALPVRPVGLCWQLQGASG